MSFTNERIRGIVAQARYSDPEVEAFIAETLIARRDAIGRHWCGETSPLDAFRVQELAPAGQRVEWTDRAVQWGVEDGPSAQYRAELFHNDIGGRDERIGTAAMSAGADAGGGAGVLVTAEQLQEADRIYREKHRSDRDRLFYLKVRVRRGDGEWGHAVKAHLFWVGPEAGFDLAGVERE
jgi:hypothetical protein